MLTSKEKIIEAAIEVFFDKGFDGASMREIAEKAGLTKPMIYYHFKNKEALYLELIEEYLELFCQGLESLLAEDSDPRARLSAIIDFFEQTFARGARVYNIIQRETIGNGHYVDLLTEKYFIKLSQNIAGFLQQGQQSGFIRPDLDPQLAEMSLISILLLYFSGENVFQHMGRSMNTRVYERSAFKNHIFNLFTVGMPTTETGA
ncbi:MAG: TetR/AcrR family transcriptional regulator [Deltaproteobacteria bacterium]|nr:TetR/AcrR family transcriptional regulator [Deltaproteobacteria bacterium]